MIFQPPFKHQCGLKSPVSATARVCKGRRCLTAARQGTSFTAASWQQAAHSAEGWMIRPPTRWRAPIHVSRTGYPSISPRAFVRATVVSSAGATPITPSTYASDNLPCAGESDCGEAADCDRTHAGTSHKTTLHAPERPKPCIPHFAAVAPNRNATDGGLTGKQRCHWHQGQVGDD